MENMDKMWVAAEASTHDMKMILPHRITQDETT